MTRAFYNYTVALNLTNPVFKNYDLRLNFKAQDAEYFSEYKECVDDCHNMLNHFMEFVEFISKEPMVLAWEANPSRSDESAPRITPKEQWSDSEIIHIFLFKKEEDITTKSKPIAAGVISIAQFEEGLIPFTH
jgi:hypothetical protein